MKRTLFILLVLVACCAAAAQTGEARRRVLIETSRGKMTVELFNETPIHRDNFISLVRSGAYRGVLFHRVINQFMVQSGNLLSKNAKPLEDLGNDTITRTLPAEIDPSKHFHRTGCTLRGATRRRRESRKTLIGHPILHRHGTILHRLRPRTHGGGEEMHLFGRAEESLYAPRWRTPPRWRLHRLRPTDRRRKDPLQNRTPAYGRAQSSPERHRNP